jgi:hypothetical protein
MRVGNFTNYLVPHRVRLSTTPKVMREVFGPGIS